MAKKLEAELANIYKIEPHSTTAENIHDVIEKAADETNYVGVTVYGVTEGAGSFNISIIDDNAYIGRKEFINYESNPDFESELKDIVKTFVGEEFITNFDLEGTNFDIDSHVRDMSDSIYEKSNEDVAAIESIENIIQDTEKNEELISVSVDGGTPEEYMNQIVDTSADIPEYMTSEQFERLYSDDDFYETVFEDEMEVQDSYNDFMKDLSADNGVPDLPLPEQIFEKELEVMDTVTFRDIEDVSSVIVKEYAPVIEKGLIPPVMRDKGEYSSKISIANEKISEIRENGQPDFGKMLGGTIDTAKEVRPLYGISIEDVKQYIPDEQKDAVSKVNVFVDRGKGVNISAKSSFGMVRARDFSVANITTFEFIMEKGPRHYTSFITDDLGSVYRSVPGYENTMQMDIEGTQISFLDRTNIDSPHHFSSVEKLSRDENGSLVKDEKGHFLRETVDGKPVSISEEDLSALRTAIEEYIPTGLDKISEKMESDILDKKTEIENVIPAQTQVVSELNAMYDNLETLKEYIAGDIETKAVSKDETPINEIAKNIVDTIDEINSNPNNKVLVEKLDDLKVQYKDCLEAFWSAGSNLDLQEYGNFSEISESTDALKEILNDAEAKLDTYKTKVSEYDQVLNTISSLSSEDRFIMISLADDAVNDVPTVLDKETIETFKADADAIVLKEKLVKEWNDDPDHKDMRLSVDKNTGEIWSQYGFKVECDKENNHKNSFNPEKMTVDRNNTPLFETEKSGVFDEESIETFAASKVPNTDIKIQDIGKVFYDETVRKGISLDKIENLSKGGFRDKGFELGRAINGTTGLSKDSIDFANNIWTEISGIEIKTEQMESKSSDNLEKSESAAIAKDNRRDSLSRNDIERIAKTANNRAFGKIDRTVNVELSDTKLSEYKEKLSNIKERILELDDKMTSYNNWPPLLVSGNFYFNNYKLEYDRCVYRYEKMGGKVGEGCFISKGVSKAELFADFLSCIRSNLIESTIEQIFIGTDIDDKETDQIKDIEKGEVSENVEQEPDESEDVEKPDVTESVEEEPDELEGVEQPEDALEGIEEEPDELEGIEQSEDAPECIEEELDESEGIEQLEDASEGIEEESDESEGIEQPEDASEGVEQKPDKSEDVEHPEEDSKTIEQENVGQKDPLFANETEDNLSKEDAIVAQESQTNKKNSEEDSIKDNEDHSTDTENLVEKVKENISDFLQGKDELRATLVDSMSSGLSVEDLITNAMDVIQDYASDITDITDDTKCAVGELVVELSEFSNENVSDMRDFLNENIENIFGSDAMEGILSEEVAFMESADTYDLDKYGTLETLDFTVDAFIDNGLDINSNIDSQDISYIDNETQNNIDQTKLAEEIDNSLIDRGLDEDIANNIANAIVDDYIENMDTSEPVDVSQAALDVLDQIDSGDININSYIDQEMASPEIQIDHPDMPTVDDIALENDSFDSGLDTADNFQYDSYDTGSVDID